MRVVSLLLLVSHVASQALSEIGSALEATRVDIVPDHLAGGTLLAMRNLLPICFLFHLSR